MKELLIFLCLFSFYTNLKSQTTKWVKDIYKFKDEQKLAKLAYFDDDTEIDGFILKKGCLYLIQSYFTDKQDTILVTTGIEKDYTSFKIYDLNADGYLDILTLKYGGFIYSSTQKKFNFLQLPFITDSKATSLEVGFINSDSLPDIIINSSTLYLTNPDLSFQKKTLDNIKNNIYAIADLNNDGYDDLITGFNSRKDGGIFGSSGTDSLSLYFQLNKSGNFPDKAIHIYSDKSFLWELNAFKIGNTNHLALATGDGLKLLHNSNLTFDVLLPDIQNEDSQIFNNSYGACYRIAVSDIDFDGINDLIYNNSRGIGWIKMNNDGYPGSTKFIEAQSISEINVITNKTLQQTDVIAQDGDKIFKYKKINSSPNFYKTYRLGTNNSNTIQRFKSGNDEIFLYLSGSNLKYFKYSFMGDSIVTDTTKILLKNTFSYCVDTVSGDFPIIATINKSRNAFLIYRMDPLLTLTRMDSVALSVFSYPSAISSFDYDHNSKPDILVSSRNSVDLYKDVLNYKSPVKVASQSYYNSLFSKTYPIDFTNDGKEDFVTFEYASSSWGNSYTIHFVDNNLKLKAKYDAFGYSDKLQITDWNKDGKIDIVSAADRLERYYYENDTIIKEPLSGTDDICDFGVYNKGKNQKDVLSVSYYNYQFTGKYYQFACLNTEIADIESKKYINFELIQKADSDTLNLILLNDNVVTLVKLQANNLRVSSYQDLVATNSDFSGLNVYESMFVDFDLDGKKDIMLSTNKGLIAFQNKGDLNFSAKPHAIFNKAGSYLIADLDHDNDIDLIEKSGDDILYFANDHGTYKQTDRLTYSAANELANFDDDEGYEIMADDKVYDLTNDNKFEFNNWISNKILKNYTYWHEYKLAANINGDKYTDYFIIRFNSNDTIYAVVSDGKKDFMEKPIFVGNNNYKMFIANLNNDNYDDLVVVDKFRDSLFILLNQKDFSFKINQREKLYDGDKTLTIYDFDDNGYNDLRFYNNELFLNTNGTLTISKTTNLVPVSDNYADLNGDLKNEFLFMQDGKISLYQWTKDEAPKLSSDLKTIRIGLGQYLNYKLPPNYVTDENPDLLNGYINWDFFSLAPDLQFNSLDKSIRSYYLPDKVGSYKYTLTFTDVLGKKVSDDFILEVVDALLSTEAIASTVSLICYPNPSTDVLNIKFPNGINSGGHISISNMEGKQMYTENLNSGSAWIVPVANFPKGVYFLIFTNKNIRAIAKFIKQ